MEKILMSSDPEILFSLGGMGGKRFEFHGDEECGIGGQIKVGKIFVLQMKRNGLLEVLNGFIDCFALSDHCDIRALSDILFVALKDEGFNDVFHDLEYSR